MFVSGNPGGTDGDLTVSQLGTERDNMLPHLLTRVRGLLQTVNAYSAQGSQQALQTNELSLELARRGRVLL